MNWRFVISVGVTCLALTGCGGEQQSLETPSATPAPVTPTATGTVALFRTSTATATATVTPSQTSTPTTPPPPTPSPTARIAYELTEASYFRLQSGAEEPAMGSLDVSPCYSPNTFFAYRVLTIQIASDSVAITFTPGDPGEFEAVTFYPEDHAVNFGAYVSINGEREILQGSGPLDANRSGETLNLDLQAPSLTLHLDAVRTGPPYEWTSNLCYP